MNSSMGFKAIQLLDYCINNKPENALCHITMNQGIDFNQFNNEILYSAIMTGDIRLIKTFLDNAWLEFDYSIKWKNIKLETFELIINHPKIDIKSNGELIMLSLINESDIEKIERLLINEKFSPLFSSYLLSAISKEKSNRMFEVFLKDKRLISIDDNIITKICQLERHDLLKQILDSNKIIKNFGSLIDYACISSDEIITTIITTVITTIINSGKFNKYFTAGHIILILTKKRISILSLLLRDKMIDSSLITYVIGYVCEHKISELYDEIRNFVKGSVFIFDYISICIIKDNVEMIMKLLSDNFLSERDVDELFNIAFIENRFNIVIELYKYFKQGISCIEKHLRLNTNHNMIHEILEVIPIDKEVISIIFISSIKNRNRDLTDYIYQNFNFERSTYNDALIACISYDNIDFMRTLINDKMAKLTMKDNLPLKLASYRGKIEILKELLKDSNIDPSVDDNECFLNFSNDLLRSELIKDKRVINKLKRQIYNQKIENKKRKTK